MKQWTEPGKAIQRKELGKMIFSQDTKSTDAAKWCQKYGIGFDEERLHNFEDALYLEDLTETERQNKLNFAVMRLAELEGKTEKRNYKLHETRYTDGKKEYSISGQEEERFTKLKENVDLCCIYDFSRCVLTVFYAAEEMKAKLEELRKEAKRQEEDARKVREHIEKEKQLIEEAKQRLAKWERESYVYSFGAGAKGRLKDLERALGIKTGILG